MNKLKVKAEHHAVPQATKRSVTELMEHSFGDMLKLLDGHPHIATRIATADEIHSYRQRSAMFTVSSSHFRLIVLLHYPEAKSLTASQLEHLRLEFQKESQQYLDYVCELGNNLCGVVCRILGNDSFSTGMSTPSLLNINNSAGHLQRTAPFFEAHMASFTAGQPLLCATFALFFNSKTSTELVINVPSAAVEDESLGELEFF